MYLSLRKNKIYKGIKENMKANEPNEGNSANKVNSIDKQKYPNGREPKEKYIQRQEDTKALTIIPKSEVYVRYMLDVLLKLPRTEKFSIGTDYKNIMYEMIRNIIYLSKVEMEERYHYTIEIDALVQIQRIYLRLMKQNKWIDEKKFKISLDMLGEIGKINGGLIKYYGKNYKKPV